MKKVEIRVRPVTRYVVTRYEGEVREDGRCSAGCSSLGEFDHEYYAERVAAAVRAFEKTSECAEMDRAHSEAALAAIIRASAG